MDSVALVEDLLDLELDDDGWETEGWGRNAIAKPDVVEEIGDDQVEWKPGVYLTVDADGRIQRPYIKRNDARSLGTVVLRSVIILVDYSESLTTSSDAFKSSSPQLELFSLIHEFVDEFFELCPLGEISVVVVMNKVAATVCALTSSAQTLHDSLEEYESAQAPCGRMSLQNGLEKCLMILSTAKPYSTKEIICLWNSTSTHDAGLIDDTIAVLSSQKIRVFTLSLKPTLYILAKLSEQCYGAYIVLRNCTALRNVLLNYTKAQPEVEGWQRIAEMISVGFPELEQGVCAALCTCHNRLKFTGFTCPRCLARNCAIPSTCSVCGLLLVKSLDIARCAKSSYEVPPFQPLPRTATAKECYICERKILSGAGMCLKCHHIFCLECDVLMHEQLLPCPGCQYGELLARQGLHLQKIPAEPPLPPEHPQAAFYAQQIALISPKEDDRNNIDENGGGGEGSSSRGGNAT